MRAQPGGALDSLAVGGSGADRFRVKIWERETGALIRDNQAAAADTADLDTDGTLVQGGSVVVHKK